LPPRTRNFGKSGELLRDADLQMVAGNALVVGDGLVVDQRAVGRVGDGDDHAPGRLPSGVPRTVVGSRGGLSKSGIGSTVTGAFGSRLKSSGSFGCICRCTCEVGDDLLSLFGWYLGSLLMAARKLARSL
jgi:hypothetical protein